MIEAQVLCPTRKVAVECVSVNVHGNDHLSGLNECR